MTRGSVDGEVSFSRSSGTAADRSDGNGAQASTILETAPALHLPKRPEDSKRRPLCCPGAPKPESAQNKNAKTPKCRNSQAGLGRMLRRTRLLRHREPRSGVAIQENARYPTFPGSLRSARDDGGASRPSLGVTKCRGDRRKYLKKLDSAKEMEGSEFGFCSAGFGICSIRLGFRSEKFGFCSGEFGNPSSRWGAPACPLRRQ